MTSLWSRLRSPLAAAGLLLCLAACQREPAAPPYRGAVFSSPAPSSAPIAPHRVSVTVPPASDEINVPSALLASENTGSAPGPATLHQRGNLLRQWAEENFTAALAYVDARPPGADREELFARLALVLAETLPAEAADLVAKDMAPGPARDEAALSVLHRWALAAPSSAARWAEAFPPGPLRDRALREVAGVASAPLVAP